MQSYTDAAEAVLLWYKCCPILFYILQNHGLPA